MINCTSYDNMFSDINSIRFINIYNLKNDKIISYTFNNAYNPILVCQKNIIINNPVVYNCCDSNFKAYECVIPYIDIQLPKNNSKIDNNNLPITDNSKIDNNIINDYTTSSNSLSTGAIIGIVVVGVIVIIVITIIICCKLGCLFKKCFYPWKKKSNSLVNQEHNASATNIYINQNINPITIHSTNSIIVHEPEKEKENPIKIIFVNLSRGDINILIDSKKTIDELIEFYFKQIGRNDLYGDGSILFLIEAKNIKPPYPKEPIETLINKIINLKTLKIVVIDYKDKMKK